MSTQSSDKQTTNDHTAEFFQTLAAAKQVTAPQEPPKPSRPRLVGLVLGALLGLVYSVASQIINPLLVPGVPLAQYPFGLAGNCLISIASGAIISLACALPRSFTNGAFLGTMVSAVVALLQWWATHAASAVAILKLDSITPWTILELGFYVALFFPFMLLLRLAIDNQVESTHKPVWSWTRLRVPLVLVVILGVIGGFSIFPTHVQRALTDMHVLIQSGLSTSNGANLPPSLAETQGVIGFLDYATPDYLLEPSQDRSLRDELSTPDEDYTLIIIARFKSNGILACAYDENGNRSHCKSFVTPEFYLTTG